VLVIKHFRSLCSSKLPKQVQSERVVDSRSKRCG